MQPRRRPRYDWWFGGDRSKRLSVTVHRKPKGYMAKVQVCRLSRSLEKRLVQLKTESRARERDIRDLDRFAE